MRAASSSHTGTAGSRASLRGSGGRSTNKGDRFARVVLAAARRSENASNPFEQSGFSANALEKRRAQIQHIASALLFFGLVVAIYETRGCAPNCFSETVGSLDCVLIPPIEEECNPNRSLMLKTIVTCLSVVGALVLVRLHFHIFFMDKTLSKLTSWSGADQTSLLGGGEDIQWASYRTRNMLIDVLLALFHCPPFVVFHVTIEKANIRAVYRVESVVALFMFVRLYFLWNSFRDQMVANFIVSRFASKTLGVHIDSGFVLRHTYAEYPFFMLTFGVIAVTCTFAFLLLIAESPESLEDIVSHIPIVNNQITELTDYWNCLWLVWVTSTTTGYGDVTPRTVLGQFIAMTVMLSGVIVVSTFTVTLTEMFQFRAREAKAERFMQG